MQELRQAALAYYHNGDPILQQLALNFFHSMDMNGDRIVNLVEFVTFLQQNGYSWIHPNFFYDLDHNRDGHLDFNEVLTFYYIIKTRNLCKRCGVCLTGLYFTCVECFDRAPDTYDLCSSCYSGRGFIHHHTCFLDNNLLLRSKRTQATGFPNLNQGINPAVLGAPERIGWSQTFQVLETALLAANLITMCTIM